MKILTQNIKQILKLQGKHLIFIRHGQSMGNQGGSLVGWTDDILTIKGREQSHSLFQSLHPVLPDFKKIYSSDLKRAYETGLLATGYEKIVQIQDLRELHFGKLENVHFDSLPDEEKSQINKIEFQAEGGESWLQVKQRVLNWSKNLDDGIFLCFAHGGLICSLTWELGLQDVVENCGAVGITLQDDLPKKLLFRWEYPQIEKL